MNKDNRNERSKDATKKYLIIWILLAVFIIIATIYYPDIFLTKFSSLERRGMHGDSYGALNALFSGLAFTGLIIAIFLQRKELQLQREELDDTRVVFKEQLSVMKIQSFESSFQFLLSNQRTLIQEMDTSAKTRSTQTIFNEFKNQVNSISLNKVKEFKLKNVEEVDLIEILDVVFSSDSGPVQTFINNFMLICRIIDSDTNINKVIYQETVNAQIPMDYKRVILYYLYWKQDKSLNESIINKCIVINLNSNTVKMVHQYHLELFKNYFSKK